MKPLELTVYPPMPTTESLAPLSREEAFRELKRASALNDQLVDKRLTNAELAAEYWCSEWRKVTPETSEAIKILSAERAEILHRFATLPHYDEVPE